MLEPYGAAHLAALVVSFLLGVAMIYMARSGRWPRALGRAETALAILILSSYPSGILARLWGGVDVSIDVTFPMHLCDIASVTAFFALVFRTPLMAELTYFWGIAGTAQALITPTTCSDFPNPVFFSFFQLHSGVVIVAAYLPLGLGWRPRPWAVLRVWLWGVAYIGLAAVVNIAFGANYAFLREKAEGSLMDALGPWPWYALAMVLVALPLFTLLGLPFVRFRGHRSRR